VLIALPLIAFAIFIVSEGGIVFAAALAGLGLLATHELGQMFGRVSPPLLAGFVGVVGLVAVAHYGEREDLVLVLALALPVTFVLALARPRREHASWAMAVTLFGTLWIGGALAHAVLLRELDHGGALLVDALIGTFIGDTAAYMGGRAFGTHKIAPAISPNKTLEGLVCGIVGGSLAFWLFAVSYQDFFAGRDALLIGFCVALAAPVGDLFESLIKRDLDVKDTGTIFGAHGGVLDRLDAVFFSVPVAYYVSLAVL
jgi:phosphatidate cytidylyltransferase